MKHLQNFSIIILMLASVKLMATELLLKPIGLSLTVNLSDWAAPNWKPKNVPAQMEIQTNDSPDNFEFQWIKDGKSKMFIVKTSRLKLGKKYVATDLSQYESELGEDGADSSASGVHAEISKILGCDCFKQTAEIPAEQYVPTTHQLTYVFYARGLRYVITSATFGKDLPPEKDPVLKAVIDSLTFIPEAKKSI